MNAALLREKCVAQQALVGARATVTLMLHGKPWGRRVNARLWPGGPTGRIVGDTFDRPGVIALTNGMTRGQMGFGNWIPVLVYGREGVSLYRPQQDATAVPVVGDMPEHPSPKPLRAMTWIASRFQAVSVIDPFAGSGTTLLAAKQLGMRAIGIELDEQYCRIAVERLRQSVLPLEVAR